MYVYMCLLRRLYTFFESAEMRSSMAKESFSHTLHTRKAWKVKHIWLQIVEEEMNAHKHVYMYVWESSGANGGDNGGGNG